MRSRASVIRARAYAAQNSSATAARSSASATSRPVTTSPGAWTSTNGTRAPTRFLSRAVAATISSTSTGSVERHGQPAGEQQLAHLRAQVLAPGEAQRDQQPQADGLAVAVAGVAGRGLDRVADGVPEVQHLPAPGVALVRGDDRELRAHAVEDRALVHLAAGRDPLPQLPAGDQRGLQHLDPAGGELRGAAASRACRGRRARPPAGGRRRRSSSPRAGRRRSCRRRRSRPGRQASWGPGRRARRAGRCAAQNPARSPTTPPPSATTWSARVMPGVATSSATRARRSRASCGARPAAIAMRADQRRRAARRTARATVSSLTQNGARTRAVQRPEPPRPRSPSRPRPMNTG